MEKQDTRERRAKAVFKEFCAALDEIDWKYEKDESNLMISSGAQGDDLPMKFRIRILVEKEVISFSSWMPFVIPEDKRVDLALAICAANYGLCQGSFDMDLSDGSILFRLTDCYTDCEGLSRELYREMVGIATHTIDDYNDKFFAISKGMMTVQEFIKRENS